MRGYRRENYSPLEPDILCTICRALLRLWTVAADAIPPVSLSFWYMMITTEIQFTERTYLLVMQILFFLRFLWVEVECQRKHVLILERWKRSLRWERKEASQTLKGNLNIGKVERGNFQRKSKTFFPVCSSHLAWRGKVKIQLFANWCSFKLN